VRNLRVWAGLLGIEHAVIERVEYDEDERVLVAHVRPSRTRRGRCGRCERRCAGYDRGDGHRWWRALDFGVVRAVVEADAPRVSCPRDGVVVAAVPWARHGAGHTRAFDDTVAWLAVACSKTAVTHLLRVAWRTVGSVITGVWADVEARVDPTNTKIRLLTRIAFGFRSPEALTALAMLSLGGYRPALPGR